ncbi:hypothetical protein T492DRAFT_895782 [Pavlovales sp. CCMP2436]|nr:hypothetical protein T492DRAFT_895782 [Pavlovales sp. CCMP2436]
MATAAVCRWALALCGALLHAPTGCALATRPTAARDPLSAAATFILRGLLTECGACIVDVRGAHRLAGGAVDGVRIEGLGWCSPGGLRCRTLDMEVSEARVDALRLLTERSIVFASPVQGEATIDFDEVDFAAFLRHPLVAPSLWTGKGGATIGTGNARPSGGCSIHKEGATFEVNWEGARRRLQLVPADGGGATAAAPLRLWPDGAALCLPIDIIVPAPDGKDSGRRTAELGTGRVGETNRADEDFELAALLRERFGGLRVDLDGALKFAQRSRSVAFLPSMTLVGGAAEKTRGLGLPSSIVLRQPVLLVAARG